MEGEEALYMKAVRCVLISSIIDLTKAATSLLSVLFLFLIWSYTYWAM